MASLFVFNSLPLSLRIPTKPARASSFRSTQQHVLFHQRLHFSGKSTALVTRAGGPNITTAFLAFSLPLSLLILTVFASIRVADKLDEKFAEELILQQAMKEADEEEEEEEEEEDEDEERVNEDDIETFLEEKTKEVARPRTRNRPKREA